MNSPDYNWLTGDAPAVAPKMLGWRLSTGAGAHETVGIITEVEAYGGADDPASHAFRGLTPRTQPMFMAGGAVYVYLSYGMHACMNIVVGAPGAAQAVLVRAIYPQTGLEIMRHRRHWPPDKSLRGLTDGPGKLTQALAITLGMSGSRLGDYIYLMPPTTTIPSADIIVGPRVGITQARDTPWRFRLANNGVTRGRVR